MPGAQGAQTADELAPTAVEYLPASHARQKLAASLPVVGAKVPARQSTQKTAENAPAVVEYLPTSQGTHAALLSLPLVGAYVPAMQSTQALDAFAPTLVLYLPDSHGMHPLVLVLPNVKENVPAAQSTHSCEPMLLEYLPAPARCCFRSLSEAGKGETNHSTRTRAALSAQRRIIEALELASRTRHARRA
jgi:hypothetical protein